MREGNPLSFFCTPGKTSELFKYSDVYLGYKHSVMNSSKRHTCATCNRKRDEYFMQMAVERSSNGLPRWTCRDNHYSSRRCTEKFKNFTAESVRGNSDVSPGLKTSRSKADLIEIIERLERENENYKTIINGFYKS